MKHRQTMVRLISQFLCTLCVMLVATSVLAYQRLDNYHWSPPSAVFHHGALSNQSFKSAFIKAMESWNGKSAFAYSGDSKYVAPCPYNPLNGVGIAPCGADFGSSTIAVTRSGTALDGSFVDVDIVFNPNINWGVHDKSATSSSVFDLTRVAVHELGHALGLDHETTKPATMQPLYHNMAPIPTADDIMGLLAIYGEAPEVPEVPEPSLFYFSTIFNVLFAD